MLQIADLFAGAGGASTSALQAAKLLGLDAHVTAINHDQWAVNTHRINHPGHVHFCDPVEAIEPRRAVPSNKLDLLIAGPSCVHFSRARGGVPKNDQQRSGAWQVFRWAEDLNPEAILVENVPEFLSWGPLDAAGRPIKDGLGAEFLRWVGALQKLGYRVEWRVLCAADYGDPTTRKRLFIQAARGAIRWPIPTHCDPKLCGSFPARAPWRAAREIIDFSIPSQSIFGRKKPLAEATLARIIAGIRRFWGEAFLVGVGGPQSLHRPIPLTDPMRSLLSQNHLALVEPFLVHQMSGGAPRAASDPLPTITGTGVARVVQPYLIRYNEGAVERTQGLDSPLGTLDTSNRYALVEPFIMKITNRGSWGTQSESSTAPITTITGQQEHALVEPFLVSYYGTGGAHSTGEPLPTQTSRDRFGIIEALEQADALDIHLRMLQPSELARAHSFPEGYSFQGGRKDQVKQIGNSWPVGMGTALCRAILEGLS